MRAESCLAGPGSTRAIDSSFRVARGSFVSRHEASWSGDEASVRAPEAFVPCVQASCTTNVASCTAAKCPLPHTKRIAGAQLQDCGKTRQHLLSAKSRLGRPTSFFGNPSATPRSAKTSQCVLLTPGDWIWATETTSPAVGRRNRRKIRSRGSPKNVNFSVNCRPARPRPAHNFTAPRRTVARSETGRRVQDVDVAQRAVAALDAGSGVG